MAEYIYVASFSVESQAYQALSELRRNAVAENLVVSQASIVRRENGALQIVDGYDTGLETSDDTGRGGLIGSIVGIVGGPVGVLLGYGMGSLIGGSIDHADAVQNASLIEKVCESLTDDNTSLIALVSEANAGAYAARLSKFQAEVICFDAAEVAEEIEKAEELQKQMEKEARQKLREEKAEARKQRVEENRSKLKADFDAFRAKFAKKA